MKKTIVPFFFAGMLLTGESAFSKPVADTTFTIQGYLPGQKAGFIYLRYQKNNLYRIDSAAVTNGRFEMTGVVSGPSYASLYTRSTEYYTSKDFYLEPGDVFVTGYRSLQDAVVQAGKSEAESQVLKNLTKEPDAELSSLLTRKYHMRENKDSVAVLMKAIKAVMKERNRLELDFITRFPDSYVSWDVIRMKTIVINPDELEPAFSVLGERFRNSEEGKAIAGKLEVAKRTWIGSEAIEFSQPDTKGKKVKLSSYRGKYVLLDFWASWCGPCRLENPYVVEAYNRFKDKGFTVLGVSMDNEKQKEKWIAAIKEDKLPWTHVSDLKGMKENEPAKLYGVAAIPQNFLIDPNGVIVAKNLRGDDLLVTLEEILNK